MELDQCSDLQPSLEEVYQAQESIRGIVLRTPLVPLNIIWPNGQIYLKLENLHPVGCFKFRNACNILQNLPPSTRAVYTISAGNFACALAWFSQECGIACTVLVPEHAPEAKTSAIEEFGAKIIRLEHKEWWQIVSGNKTYDHAEGLGIFIHPVFNKSVIAGNGTIALEVLEDLPNVTSIIVPYGGGALASGIGTVVKNLKPSVNVITSELDSSPQVHSSLAAGKCMPCDFKSTFCDGIGGFGCLSQTWPMVSKLVERSILVSLEEVASAVKVLAERNHVIAEGAGASSVAAALSSKSMLSGNIVCVVSGGNIDTQKIIQCLQGKVPA